MYKITLINMPFAGLNLPSIALTQLKSVLEMELGDRATTEVRYLNHDFAGYMGLRLYQELASMAHHPTGLGEWFFRQAAFPHLPDNSGEYFSRYYPQQTPELGRLKKHLLEKRAAVEAFLESMIDRYSLGSCELVGFTSMFSQNVASLALARLIKLRNPAAVVVMGGANCEAPMGGEYVRRLDQVDYVASGPSLRSFPRLVRCLIEGDEAERHRIDGILTKHNTGRSISEGKYGELEADGRPTVRPFGEELDINTPVALEYDLFLDSIATAFPQGAIPPALLFETSRGCWWGERAHCTFCGLNGSTMNYRAMTPERAFILFESLFRYADRCTSFESVDNILPKSYLTEVLPFLDTPPHVGLFYEVKANLTEEDFKVLARARLTTIQPGIEALNTSTLKLMRKGVSAFQNVQFLQLCLRYEITPAWNLLIGFPGEPREVYEKYLVDLPLLVHLPPPSGVFPVRFDRFSPYYEEAEGYGLKLRPLDWYRLVYPFDDATLANVAYYFADHNFTAEYFMNVARMQNRLRAAVEDWRSKWSGRESERPVLAFQRRGDRTVVIDSRFASVTEHLLNDTELQVLGCLSTPHKISHVAERMAHVSGFDAEREVRALVSRKLLFAEGDRFLSLVLPEPVAQGAGGAALQLAAQAS